MKIEPLSPVDPWVRGVGVRSTVRGGGFSRPPYGAGPNLAGGLNLAQHCGDEPEAVRANREALRAQLPAEPLWLEQVHGTDVLEVRGSSFMDGCPADHPPRADAAVTAEHRRVLAVLTADCLPVVFADRHARAVGVAHAGWRGLAGGVLENTLKALLRLSGGEPSDCAAWLGPAIGRKHFEVRADVWAAFTDNDPGAAACFEVTAQSGQWLADLEALARRRLLACGVNSIQGGGRCTFADPHRFFSYRRDRVTGRMATLVWID